MKRYRLIGLFAAFTLLANTGCTTTQSFEGSRTAELVQVVRPGDTLRVIEINGSDYEIVVEEVSHSTLTGHHKYNGTMEVPLARIQAAEMSKPAPAAVRVAGGILAGVALYALIEGALSAAAFGIPSAAGIH